jgi:serine phosphatase RsbU (regulator of sigma subunit)
VHRATALVALAGMLVTGALSGASWLADDGNEDRLLEQRVREAGAVIGASTVGVERPLVASAEVAEITGGRDADAFERVIGGFVGPGRSFVSASIWPVGGTEPAPVLVLGSPPALAARPAEEVRRFLQYTASTPALSILPLLDSPAPRLGYSYTSERTPAAFVAYAEAALPPDRTAVVQPDNAFTGLTYALYLGDVEDPSQLLLAGTAELPLQGRRASERIPFGDRSLLLVMAPTRHLGGDLLAILPWLVLAAGLLLTGGAAAVTERLARRNEHSERLAAENARLYDQQREVAVTLQHNLLPHSLPDVEGMELAVRYVPGVEGMEIGGDWYDAIRVDDRHLLLVVGDVSGRGLGAAGPMASLRYSARAYGSQGDDPATILRKLNDHAEPDLDGSFATVVCARLDLKDRTVSVASAGHPPPLLIGGGEARFITMETRPPIGVRADIDYALAEEALPAEGTLVLFTDGLYERRGEVVDSGLERLRRHGGHDAGPLDAMLTSVLSHMTSDEVSDDVALLAVQWTS